MTVTEIKERTINEMSNKAFKAGKEFGKEHRFSEFEEDRTSRSLMDRCPAEFQGYADVFKYGAQSAWRRQGEMPGMTAYDLEPGDIFKVYKPDHESPVRVCLEHRGAIVRFGWPNKDYWCDMGFLVPVELVKEES